VRPLPFVGRARECARLRSEFVAGRSVVLTGIHGIGRTALARHLADELARDFRFAFCDLETGPGGVWRELFAALHPRAHARLRHEPRSVPWTRHRVLNKAPEDPRRHVVVVDNVARLSARGLDLMRRLRERFLVLAIAEAFLPEQPMSELCLALWTRGPMRLGYLSRAATACFLEECVRRHGFAWGRAEVQGLARALAGFPLGMREVVAAELRRRERRGVGCLRAVSRYAVTAPSEAEPTERAYLARAPER